MYFRKYEEAVTWRVLHRRAMAAQLIPRKGHDVLLEAVAALKDRWPQLRVLIMGKGPLAASVAQQIEAMGLEEQVHCVGFLNDIETVLPHLDFLVHFQLL